MTQLNFDATTVAPQESLSPIPAGVYLAQIVDSDVQPLRSGRGTGLQLTFQVLEGACANRKVWTSLNIRHENSEAERIAQSQLSAICLALGQPRLSDSVQLHNKPIRIRVTIRKDETGQYGDRNEIKGYEAAGGAVRSTVNLPNQAPAPAAPAKAPWQRAA